MDLHHLLHLRQNMLQQKSASHKNSAANILLNMAQAGLDALLQQLGANRDGLSQLQAAQRLANLGDNQVAQKKPLRWYVQLFLAIRNPFVILLGVIASLSLLSGDKQAAYMIACMVAISVSLRFWQERRSLFAAIKLNEMVKVTASVQRIADDAPHDPVVLEIPIAQVVPGDIVQLRAGDMIPADVRLLSCKDLFVSQAALTGEGLPVEKHVPQEHQLYDTILEAPHICFLGSNVVSGFATALVLATGPNTYLGNIAHALTAQKHQSYFDAGITKISWLLIRITSVVAVLVFLINGCMKHDWMQAFLFAISVAVGLTPEMLPMVISGALALGSMSMARKKVIIKQLESIQVLGSMQILCTDKTGTLTRDKVVLMRCCDISGQEDDDVFKFAYLNSYHQTGLKNVLDHAILEAKKNISTQAQKFDEIPFDFSRRRMSVAILEDGVKKIITKGAPQEVLACCSHFELNNDIHTIENLLLPELQEEIDKLSCEGFRVLALAYKILPDDTISVSKEDESKLILRGYVAFLDPPKESAQAAIAALMHHGIQIKVLTGDNDIITRKVCNDVGLDTQTMIIGRDIETCDDAALTEICKTHHIFARLTPLHKERVIRSLRAAGYVVGFLGDGINDAAALLAADVGISVNNAVDIAKESADIILLEKNLLVLEDGVLEGRRVFANIIKYLRMGLSSNLGNICTLVGASFLLPFLPILPMQILLQNLLYDFSQMAIPLDQVDTDEIEHPRQWNMQNLLRFMLVFGPLSSVFDYVTFALLYTIFASHQVDFIGLFQSGWFVEGLLSQTLVVHLIRTKYIPFLQSRPAFYLALSTTMVMLIGTALPFVAMGHAFGLQPLPISYMASVAGLLLCYILAVQVVKTWFCKKYGFV